MKRYKEYESVRDMMTPKELGPDEDTLMGVARYLMKIEEYDDFIDLSNWVLENKDEILRLYHKGYNITDIVNRLMFDEDK
jgi:hypothetical protein